MFSINPAASHEPGKVFSFRIKWYIEKFASSCIFRNYWYNQSREFKNVEKLAENEIWASGGRSPVALKLSAKDFHIKGKHNLGNVPEQIFPEVAA